MSEELKLIILAVIIVAGMVTSGLLALNHIITGEQFLEIFRYAVAVAVSLYAGYRIGVMKRG
ncbi:MAG: hypothetical protein QW491_09415 [Thermoproteota archaeon]